uniref:NADH-ubiquinone oxidoreductase chain 3 n=1 Tax=Cryphonectria parasitica TaxID=5116 RepID=A0A191MX69_CRYPA|nr:NADH dehydrogenase subunit 3 [Cryphonectria parasitica]
MSSMTLFILFVNIIAILFLVLNLLFAPHNPYAEKFSSFECGFHSFLGQNRSQFNVKFFIFGLLFLLFDLEITLIFPFAVSQSTNGLYGLIIVLIFMVIITLGFVYELGKGALKIDSKQNFSNLSNNSTNYTISYLGKGKTSLNNNIIGRLPLRGDAHSIFPKKLYSTSTNASKDSLEFWKKVNSTKIDENNPFYIVNRFLKDFPKRDLAIKNINVQLINSILSRHLPGFNLTLGEYNILNTIKPVRFELPVDQSFVEQVGKYTQGGFNGIDKAGVYKFTNKNNGESYIGSSISLVNRLATGYFGPKLGNRVIDLAIKGAGLDNFYLEIYFIPKNIVEDLDITLSDLRKKAKYLVLALEQILLLVYNPEYNVLKVAGSPAGLKRTPESMLPSFIKSSKATYFYDIKNKELLYISQTRGELWELIPIGSNIGKYLHGKNRFYLDQFFISDHPLSEDVYTTNLRSKDDLLTYVKELSVDWRKAQMSKNVNSTRKDTYSKQARSTPSGGLISPCGSICRINEY